MYKCTYPSTPGVEDVGQEVTDPGQSLGKGGQGEGPELM